jgi:hypothetical protein
MKKYFLYILLCVGLVSVSWSTVLNVPGTYSTISAACVAAVSGDTIIVASGTYVGDAILIDSKSIAIIGQGATRPICALVHNWDASASAGVGTAALGIRSSGTPNPMNVYIENLTIIPSNTDLSATRALWGIEVNSGAAAATDFTINVNLTDVLVCPNDGSNQPVTTDGLSYVAFDPLVAIPFRDEGIWVYGNTNLYMTRVIVSNNRATGSAGGVAANTDGIVYYPDFSSFTCQMNEGCVISYNNRIGLQMVQDGCEYILNGTKANPIKFIGNGWYNSGNGDIAIFCEQVGGLGRLTLNNVLVESVNSNCVTSYYAPDTGMPISISNSIFVATDTNVNKCCWLVSQQIGQIMTLDNVTFLTRSDSSPAIYVASDAGGPQITGNNVIIANNAGPKSFGIRCDDAAALVTLNNSAVVTNGTYALASTIGGSATGGITLSGSVINADPMFRSLADTSPDFLDVTNTFYANKGPGGIPLVGGADFSPTIAIAPAPPMIVSIGVEKLFTVVGSVGSYSGWTTSNPAVGLITSFGGDTANFNALSVGSTTISVTDGNGYTFTSDYVSVLATSAPLYKEVESRKYIRFELFN